MSQEKETVWEYFAKMRTLLNIQHLFLVSFLVSWGTNWSTDHYCQKRLESKCSRGQWSILWKTPLNWKSIKTNSRHFFFPRLWLKLRFCLIWQLILWNPWKAHKMGNIRGSGNFRKLKVLHSHCCVPHSIIKFWCVSLDVCIYKVNTSRPRSIHFEINLPLPHNWQVHQICIHCKAAVFVWEPMVQWCICEHCICNAVFVARLH